MFEKRIGTKEWNESFGGVENGTANCSLEVIVSQVVHGALKDSMDQPWNRLRAGPLTTSSLLGVAGANMAGTPGFDAAVDRTFFVQHRYGAVKLHRSFQSVSY